MVRGNMMNALSGFERLLLFLGLLLLSVCAAGRIYSSLYSHLAVHEFWGSHGSLTAAIPPAHPGEILEFPISACGRKNELKRTV